MGFFASPVAGPVLSLLSLVIFALLGTLGLFREIRKSRNENSATRREEVDRAVRDALEERDRDHQTELARLHRELDDMRRERDYQRGRVDALETQLRANRP